MPQTPICEFRKRDLNSNLFYMSETSMCKSPEEGKYKNIIRGIIISISLQTYTMV